MSIFDTLRYPVSIPLQRAEHEAIPTEILAEYSKRCAKRDLEKAKGNYGHLHVDDLMTTTDRCLLLRKVIAEW